MSGHGDQQPRARNEHSEADHGEPGGDTQPPHTFGRSTRTRLWQDASTKWNDLSDARSGRWYWRWARGGKRLLLLRVRLLRGLSKEGQVRNVRRTGQTPLRRRWRRRIHDSKQQCRWLGFRFQYGTNLGFGKRAIRHRHRNYVFQDRGFDAGVGQLRFEILRDARRGRRLGVTVFRQAEVTD
jgi:hypothetical protein